MLNKQRNPKDTKDKITEMRLMKDGFPNPALVGKNTKLDSHIYSIKESFFESPLSKKIIDDNNGPTQTFFSKQEELSQAEKMRMTDNRHDKRN